MKSKCCSPCQKLKTNLASILCFLVKAPQDLFWEVVTKIVILCVCDLSQVLSPEFSRWAVGIARLSSGFHYFLLDALLQSEKYPHVFTPECPSISSIQLQVQPCLHWFYSFTKVRIVYTFSLMGWSWISKLILIIMKWVIFFQSHWKIMKGFECFLYRNTSCVVQVEHNTHSH